MISNDASLQQYFSELQADVTGIAANAGGEKSFVHLESAFSELVTRLMAEMGLLVAEPELCPYEGTVGNALLRLSACAISDDMDRLDLFVSLYESVDQTFEVKIEEIRRAAGQCMQFLRYCANGTLARKIPSGDQAASLACLIESSWKGLDQIKIWVLTNGMVKNSRFKPQEIEGKLVYLEVVHILRLSRMAQEGEQGDPVNIDFARECGESLPCVFYSEPDSPYDTALCLLPGEVLRTLYEKYDARLLEANVRSFLSMQSKVNKGMYATLRDAPENFLAFNNGVVIVADQLQISRTSTGTTGIKVLTGLRIVNGGQTSATLFFGKRRDKTLDLSKIRVPAKIIVIKGAENEKTDEFLTDIARFANTQNNVRASDLSSSSPFHINVERLARTTWCPDGERQWFYERTTGAYRTMLAKEPTTAARKRKKLQIPLENRITKLDLAKFLNGWFGHPEEVCLSPQKNYALFMKSLDEKGGEEAMPLTSATWKDMVSVALLYRACYKLAAAAYPGYGSVIAAYTHAIAGKKLAGRVRLRTIWEKQGISDQLTGLLEAWEKEINGVMRLSALGKSMSEWGRDPECWKFVLESVETPVPEDLPEIKKDASPASSCMEKPEAEPAPEASPESDAAAPESAPETENAGSQEK